MRILNRYIYCLFVIGLVYSGDANHLIFNRICITPDQAQFIEIYNPLDTDVDLSNYYLSDQNEYFNWPDQDAGSSRDFLFKFPNGSVILSKGTFVITTQSISDFSAYYDYLPDISIIDTEFEESDIGSNAELSSNDEMLILFYKDEDSVLYQDVDYFLWGTSNRGVSKTIDDGYPYNDTPLEEQKFIRKYVAADFSDSLYVRVDINEYDEVQSEGNGITGHDETSEDFTLSWVIEGYEKTISFQDITNGLYDCAGDSKDGCPLGSLDCPVVNPSGMIVDYFDVTVYGGPHAITIEDEDGYRIELTIWPDTWDIANDPDYSSLLDPPYNRFLVQGFGNVFEYDGEKQILICSPDDLEIVQNYDMEGEYEIEEIEAYCYHYICDDDNSLDQTSCIESGYNWIAETLPDINQESCEQNSDYIWMDTQYYNFQKASIDPAPFVLVPSANEVLDYSYSFPSNSRVIIRVFDISGRFITTLADKYYPSSGVVKREKFYSAWDGTDHIGQVLPPGTYLMHMEASNFQTGKTSIDVAPVVIGARK